MCCGQVKCSKASAASLPGPEGTAPAPDHHAPRRAPPGFEARPSDEIPMDAPAQRPILTGRHVRRRPIFHGDYDYLYALTTDEELCGRIRYRGKTPSPEQFEHQLWHNVAAQFVIELVSDGRRIGHVTAFDANE